MLSTGKAPERPLVLLAEPHAIIAHEIATELDDAGYAVAGPLSTCADLRIWTAGVTPHAAIFRLTLRDGPCLTEAAELARRGVPVAIVTNSGASAHDRAVTWFGGLVEPRILVQFLRTRTGFR